MEAVLSFLDGLEDDRQQGKVDHILKDIVVIVLFATLADCDQWTEIEEWAKYHQGLLKKVIELAHGVPSQDTIQRVMASIKPETFKKLLETWQKMLNNNEGEKLKQILAIDESATALPRQYEVTGTRTRTRCTRTKGPQYPHGRKKAGYVLGRNRRTARGKKSR